MIKIKNIFSGILISILSSCVIAPATNNPDPKINISNKLNADKIQTIILKDKIILPKPLDINSNEIKNEIIEIEANKNNSDQLNKISYWSNSVIRWNEISRSLVSKYKTDFLNASRIYTILSVAQYDTLVNTYQNKYLYNRGFRTSIKTPSFPSEKASIAEVSYQVLSYFYPQEKDFLLKKATENKESGFWGNEHLRSDNKAGEIIGKAVAEKFIEYIKNDNSDKANEPVNIINSIESWKNNGVALLPSWGKVKPWILDSVENVPVTSPPSFNSEEFKKALEESIKLSNSFINNYEDSEESNLTLPDFLNKYTSQLIEIDKVRDLKSSSVLAFLNMAIMDPGISSWNTKYKYQIERPYKFNNNVKFTDTIYNSNSPSYTSENVAFMASGSEIIKYIFPSQNENLNLISDKYKNISLGTGINYTFEIDEGIKNGKYIGSKALEVYKNKSGSIDSIIY